MFKIKKGFTLVELIVSLAIISIVLIGFLSIFVWGYKGIINTGYKSKALFKAQKEIEDNLSDKPLKGDIGNRNLEITFGDGSNINIEGKIENETSKVNNKQVTFSVFKTLN